jgi:hypothetical protein
MLEWRARPESVLPRVELALEFAGVDGEGAGVQEDTVFIAHRGQEVGC